MAARSHSVKSTADTKLENTSLSAGAFQGPPHETSFPYAETALRLQEIFNKSRKIEEFETKDRVPGITTANFS